MSHKQPLSPSAHPPSDTNNDDVRHRTSLTLPPRGTTSSSPQPVSAQDPPRSADTHSSTEKSQSTAAESRQKEESDGNDPTV